METTRKRVALTSILLSAVLLLSLISPFNAQASSSLAQTITAVPSDQLLTVDGVSVDVVAAYNIGGDNFFKLRDIAMLVVLFNIRYSSGRIEIILGVPYIPNGTESTVKPSGYSSIIESNDKVYMDGSEVALAAYKIDGANYYRLRDLGTVFGFDVDYDAATRTMIITTPDTADPTSPEDLPDPEDAPTPSDPEDAPTSPASTEVPAPINENEGDLMSLLASGSISIKINGDIITMTTVELTNKTNRELKVTIPLGIYFSSNNSSVQSMIVREPSTVTLRAGSSSTVKIMTACMDISRAIPESRNEFTAKELGSNDKLAKVIALCYERNVSYTVTQAAVWIVTDNPGDFALVSTLINGNGDRVISSRDVATAREIVRDAG